jgi:hypothetical protein
LSGESSSLKRVIKLPFNLSVKLVSVSWGSSKKDRLGSYFTLIFLGGEPEVVVEAIDPAAMGWDGRWGLLVMACKLIGGILMGDYSEYFFGSGRRYDLRMGL